MPDFFERRRALLAIAATPIMGPAMATGRGCGEPSANRGPQARLSAIGDRSSFQRGEPGATPRPLADKLADTVSVLDFIPEAYHRSIASGACNVDLGAYFAAAATAATNGTIGNEGPAGTVFVPNGTYTLDHVPLRDVVFVGESRDATRIKARSLGGPDDFMFDAMAGRAGDKRRGTGNGWVVRMTIDGNGMGRSCLRTYGGGVSAHDLILKNGSYGLSVGLPIWSSFSNIYAVSNRVGFHTFCEQPGDAGTSTTFENCWAFKNSLFGFHISQVAYSAFLNCVAQDSGSTNFFVEGDRNGSPAVYSLQFIGCGTEGFGAPFHFRKVRNLTFLGGRLIDPSKEVDFLHFDDSSGSIRDFSTLSKPGSGHYSLRITGHTSGLGSILLDNSDIVYNPADAPWLTILGGNVNGHSRLQTYETGWNDAIPEQRVSARIQNVDGMTGLVFSSADGIPLLRLRRTGTPIFASSGPIHDPEESMRNGDISLYVDPATNALAVIFKDHEGIIRTTAFGR